MKLFFILFSIILTINNLSFAQRYEPVAIDSRIKTFIYSENEIYNLKFRIGYQSIIEFSKDEAIETISLGDPYPWKLTPIERRLFIKPIEPGAQTNMTVMTNKRIYLFEIESEVSANVERADVVHVARFFYPNTNYDKVLDLNYTAPKNQLQAIVKDKATQGATNSINILYSFVGEANISTPIEIFDDKKRTYIRFKSGIDYDKLKINFSKSKTNLVDIKFKKTGDFIVLDGVYSRLTIKYSDKTTQVFNDILDSK